MKKIYLLAASFFFISLPHVHTQAASLPPETVHILVTNASQKYSVDPEVIWRTLWCESSFRPGAVGDLELGISLGIAQINRRWHPEIRPEDSLNPAFSIDFMAREMSEGRSWKWSCFKDIYGLNHNISIR